MSKEQDDNAKRLGQELFLLFGEATMKWLMSNKDELLIEGTNVLLNCLLSAHINEMARIIFEILPDSAIELSKEVGGSLVYACQLQRNKNEERKNIHLH